MPWYQLPQALGAGEVYVDSGFEFVIDRQAALEFGEDSLSIDEDAMPKCSFPQGVKIE